MKCPECEREIVQSLKLKKGCKWCYHKPQHNRKKESFKSWFPKFQEKIHKLRANGFKKEDLKKFMEEWYGR